MIRGSGTAAPLFLCLHTRLLITSFLPFSFYLLPCSFPCSLVPFKPPPVDRGGAHCRGGGDSCLGARRRHAAAASCARVGSGRLHDRTEDLPAAPRFTRRGTVD